MESVSILILSLCFVSSALSADPVVTLSHRGQLKGKSSTWNGTLIDLFLGVRYANPPIGELRFSKPEEADSWVGEVNATNVQNACPQTPDGAGLYELEDCLFLDITAPGGVQTQNLKPVMVWIHGGGYTTGYGSFYLAAPLAVHGDVVVVVLNYRLGLLGFLSDGESTGNFGLWDQRMALKWVQANIDQFGGDPHQVTIFGESAGAGSVAAQVMSQRTSGLFKGAIQQSGSFYAPWAWFLTKKLQATIHAQIRIETECCDINVPIYTCFDGMSTKEVFGLQSSLGEKLGFVSTWMPTADNDFFAAELANEDYDFPNSVDLMVGFNGQEGGINLFYDYVSYYAFTGVWPTGVTEDHASSSVKTICDSWNPKTPDTCHDFVMEQYALDEDAITDLERAIRLSYAYGELNFNADCVRQLRAHSSTNKATYGYYFTELYEVPDGLLTWTVPAGTKVSADHAEEIGFVFGVPHAVGNPTDILGAYYGEGVDPYVTGYYNNFPGNDSLKHLSTIMMTGWTNFAKSGDPNSPMAMPDGIPSWPEFTAGNNEQFLEINANDSAVVETPEKARLDAVIDTLFQARTEQYADQTVSDKEESPCSTGNHKGVAIGQLAAVTLLLYALYMLI